ncbi:MAG: hypothetical protein HOK52_07515 [Candidatus Marinimicrobia bacterium]|jgi:hypothetical protein|nr:hypothetical protein [Candidatus Neomarinimicrobiota bacterium]MBT6471091.1 hypothetical protein [Candidatus Neomarinimicrobiota bacterium]
MPDFKTEIYPEILNRLSGERRYFTKTNNEPNFVKINNDIIEVRTMKSSPNYEIVPYELFETTWKILKEKRRVTQNDLSKVHYVKRSAFMFIAFDLLDEVTYKDYNNSLVLK